MDDSELDRALYVKPAMLMTCHWYDSAQMNTVFLPVKHNFSVMGPSRRNPPQDLVYHDRTTFQPQKMVLSPDEPDRTTFQPQRA